MNLQTTYLGLSLAHPVIASASPLSATFDGIRRLEDAGEAAIVAASLRTCYDCRDVPRCAERGPRSNKPTLH